MHKIGQVPGVSVKQLSTAIAVHCGSQNAGMYFSPDMYVAGPIDWQLAKDIVTQTVYGPSWSLTGCTADVGPGVPECNASWGDTGSSLTTIAIFPQTEAVSWRPGSDPVMIVIRYSIDECHQTNRTNWPWYDPASTSSPKGEPT